MLQSEAHKYCRTNQERIQIMIDGHPWLTEKEAELLIINKWIRMNIDFKHDRPIYSFRELDRRIIKYAKTRPEYLKEKLIELTS
jgi:hypothetical protein